MTTIRRALDARFSHAARNVVERAGTVRWRGQVPQPMTAAPVEPGGRGGAVRGDGIRGGARPYRNQRAAEACQFGQAMADSSFAGPRGR